MLAGIREILITSTPHDLRDFKRLLVHNSACLVLGDNIFQGAGFTKILREAVNGYHTNVISVQFRRLALYDNGPHTYSSFLSERSHNAAKEIATLSFDRSGE